MLISVQDTIDNLNFECKAPPTTSTSTPTTCSTEVETQSVNEITITAGEFVKFTIDGVEWWNSDIIPNKCIMSEFRQTYGGAFGGDSWSDGNHIFMNVNNIKLAQERVFTNSYSIKCRRRYHK